MVEVYSPVLKKTISVDRIINKIKGPKDGPTVVFFAGIHGNETAGVFALSEELQRLNSSNAIKNGVVYGICGNLKALELNQRYVFEDLNRIWTTAKIEALKNSKEQNPEEKEQVEVFNILKKILEEESGPFYFIDFHTTSSKTIPFITINDALINRKFSMLFPVPIVLGIEEYLEGPLLSYINKLGYVSLGFESGEHKDKESISNCVAFIQLSLFFSGNINGDNFPPFSLFYNQLKENSENLNEIFEVIHVHQINDNETFKMQDDFKSFQNIHKGMLLAKSDSTPIYSAHNAKIFMPLYQKHGNEGFFIIKKIRPIYLFVSEVVRSLKMDGLLVFLPGVSWENNDKTTLLVNLKVAKFLAKPIFHLLGYRNRQVDTTHIKLYNRERAVKETMYNDEFWFK